MKKITIAILLLLAAISPFSEVTFGQQKKETPKLNDKNVRFQYESDEIVATITINSDSTYINHTYWKAEKEEYSTTSSWSMHSKDVILLWPEEDGSPSAFKIENGNLMEIYEDMSPATDEKGQKIIFKKIK